MHVQDEFLAGSAPKATKDDHTHARGRWGLEGHLAQDDLADLADMSARTLSNTIVGHHRAALPPFQSGASSIR